MNGKITNISAVMILKNAENSLITTLNSLELFEEVVILDNGSTDKSLEIAAMYNNVKVFHSEFIGFGPLKNKATSYASNDWVFSIDSDEVPDEQLLSEIRNFDLNKTDTVGVIHRSNEYLGKVISGTDWGNEYVTRLYNRKVTQFTNAEVHETIETKGLNRFNFKGVLLHESYTSVDEIITKMQLYTGLYAKQNAGEKKVSAAMIPVKALFAFFRSYFLKSGFMFGWRGFLISSYIGIDVFFKYFKLYELNYKNKYYSNKKRVLVDFERLKYPNCGLGQVSINFSNQLTQIEDDSIQWEFLLSSKDRKKFILNKSGILFRIHDLFTKNGVKAVDEDIDLFHLTHQIINYKADHSKKSIYTIHDLNFLEEKSEQQSQATLNKIQSAIDRSDVITVISEFTKNIVKKHLDIPIDKPIKVIYNGVKSPILPTSNPPALVDDSLFFFTIGTVMPKKNFHVLVKMMAHLDEKYKLYIAGNPEKTKYVQKIEEIINQNGLQDRVKLLGPISDEEKSYLFKNCEGFFFPSLLEGFGLPIIESMYAQKPTFSSNRTSLPEIGKDHVYYWDNFDPLNMAQVVMDGLKDFNDNKEEKQKELLDYASQFTWEKNAEKYHQLYKELLEL
ncbi:glycosyltransferase [Flammeovirga yaeyamensis]|uniref:Glycosyltransferase n=1 Tax=Flammeovirga yaeyamensis TaxID=367791 RepID=A0AAX1N8P6_9BACT|nr:glycosyltransferase [Flammeovirga yaeyamensis]MBB3701440.1 glycosyltransferase involved in cell wall biosynthesis [Flammeovirga yaeyamensis]NMF38528.1 glycosyltransferase [Flammeovirga yaeyamensis]QWG02392.1 glycosyltransferase [Flammeovirga yaeyamensis]